MNIEIKIDKNCEIEKIIFIVRELSPEINSIINNIKQKNDIIVGFKEGNIELLEKEDIFRFFSSKGKVFAETLSGEYIIRLRLYEIEEKLRDTYFVRISNSEIVNLKKVKKLDLSYTGTIRMIFINQKSTFVSRRYVSKIKNKLNI